MPAGAKVDADDEAILAGTLPIVKVKDTVVDPEVMAT